jgi:hypothetical protein
MAVIYAAYVFRGDARVPPGGGDSGTHDVFCCVAGACVEAVDSRYGAAGDFVESSTVGGVADGLSEVVRVVLRVVEWVRCT